ncbi:MAG: FAD-dependent oxidoreductase [bacterium]
MLEKLDTVGGRANVYRQDGFVFDGGPTVVTAPSSSRSCRAFRGAAHGPTTSTCARSRQFYRIRFDDGAVFDHGRPRRDAPRDRSSTRRMWRATSASWR